MSKNDTLLLISQELGCALSPLALAVSAPEQLAWLIERLGWELPEDVDAIGIDAALVDAVVTDTVALMDLAREPDTSDEGYSLYTQLVTDVAALLVHLYEDRQKIAQCFSDDFRNKSGIVDQLPVRLLDYLIVEYLSAVHAPIFHFLITLGVVELKNFDADAASFTSRHERRIVNYDRIPKALFDPASLFATVYQWGKPSADINLFLERLYSFFLCLGSHAGLRYPELDRELALTGAPAPSPGEQAKYLELHAPLVQIDAAGIGLEAGISIMAMPPEAGGTAPGVAICPYAQGTLDKEVPLDEAGRWVLRFEGKQLDVAQNLGLVIHPGGALKVVADLGGAGHSVAGELSLSLRRQAAGEERFPIFGTSGVSFSAHDIGVGFGVSTDLKNGEFFAEFEIGKAQLSVSGADADGFLKKILPENPITLDFDLTLGYSSTKGFFIKGAAALEYTFNLNLSLGPITISTIDVRLGLGSDNVVTLVIAATVDGELGPVAATVSKIGLQLALEPGKRGALGNADLSLGFKPPSGVGLAIDASCVKGGGFLEIEEGNYAGILNLEIQEKIAVTAIGILTTRLPDGSKIFSLKVIGMVEFPPIQLGYGFFLSGIGLAVAIECTMNAEALRNSVYSGSLTSLLFPPDPVKNAAKIIADIKSFFPPKNGSFVFGAMVKMGWGGATSLIKAAVGIFIEIEGSSLARIALAGDIVCELPNKDSAILHVEMQFIGILDLANCTLSLDASIVNSFLTKFTLAGDMALRTSWGEKARFAMSAGGFYPGYRAPESFPALVRISICLGDDNPRIGLFAYMALAENSVQFGAQLLFYFSKDIFIIGLFEVDGAMGFDALINFNPFSFECDLFARLTVKRNRQTFCGIDLYLYLSGPNDYHAVGHAKVEICGISAKVEFDKHFGSKSDEIPPAVLSPLGLLLKELQDDRNWSVSQPPSGAGLVTLRDGEDAKAYVDTAGGLVFHQQSVPLTFRIEKLGEGVIPPGEEYFDLAAGAEPCQEVEDSFALGQFQHLSDQEKISAPPFEKMKSGISFSSRRVDVAEEGAQVVGYGRGVGYRTLPNDRLVGGDAAPAAPGLKPFRPKPVLLRPFTLEEWKTRAGRRYHLRSPSGGAAAPARIEVGEDRFTVATAESTGDGRFRRAPGAAEMTYAQARRAKEEAAEDVEIMRTAKTS